MIDTKQLLDEAWERERALQAQLATATATIAQLERELDRHETADAMLHDRLDRQEEQLQTATGRVAVLEWTAKSLIETMYDPFGGYEKERQALANPDPLAALVWRVVAAQLRIRTRVLVQGEGARVEYGSPSWSALIELRDERDEAVDALLTAAPWIGERGGTWTC